VKATSRKRVSVWRLLAAPLVLGVLTPVVGCSRVQVGGYSDSPDGKYRLFIDTLGGYGCSYYADTAKDLYIAIHVKDERWMELLNKHYRIRGSDVTCDCNWDPSNNVTVVLYDYGPGVAHYGLKNEESQKRIIRTVAYRFDTNTGKFLE
jgi:hypothetical protein